MKVMYDTGTWFFVHNGQSYVYEPYDYLRVRYGITGKKARKAPLIWAKDTRGRRGALVEALDRFAQER